jgi:hypothetical protein
LPKLSTVKFENLQIPPRFRRRGHWIWTRIKPEWLTSDFNESSDSIRETFGDLNIFLALHNDDKFQAVLGKDRQVKEWHLLAVISIWKLIDACELLWGDVRSQHDSGRNYVDPKILSAEVTGLAMEAQAACQTAMQLKERAFHVNNAAIAQAQFEKLKRSKQAKKAADAMNEPMHQIDRPRHHSGFSGWLVGPTSGGLPLVAGCHRWPRTARAAKHLPAHQFASPGRPGPLQHDSDAPTYRTTGVLPL